MQTCRRESIARAERTRNTSAMTLTELLIVLVIIGILIALLMPAFFQARSGRRSPCKSNLKMIGLALHNYADVYGGFPPAYTTDENGEPLHSWRTLLLTFVDQAPLYNTIDISKPWDDPVNAAAMATSLQVYRCHDADVGDNMTTYAALVGEDHFLHPDRSREIAKIEDGTSAGWRATPSEVVAQLQGKNICVHRKGMVLTSPRNSRPSYGASAIAERPPPPVRCLECKLTTLWRRG